MFLSSTRALDSTESLEDVPLEIQRDLIHQQDGVSLQLESEKFFERELPILNHVKSIWCIPAT